MPANARLCAFLARAGRGKTHSAMTQAIKRYGRKRVLGVSPWNPQVKALTKGYGVEAVTFCRLAGMNACGQLRRKAKDLEPYACVVIDEALLLSHRQMVALRALIAKNPTVAFWITGDPCQLEAVGDPADQATKERWLKDLLHTVISIRRSARLTDPAEAAMLEEIERLLLDSPNPDLRAIMLRFFHTITLAQAKAAGITRAVAYYHSTVDRLNHESQTARPPPATPCVRLGRRKTPYYEGDTLVCRVGHLERGCSLWRSVSYRILEVGPTAFTLQAMDDNMDEEDDVELEQDPEAVPTSSSESRGSKGAASAPFSVPVDRILTHFRLPGVSTLHSAQGTTVDGPLLVADWECEHACVRWLYTALTRPRRLSDVWLLVNSKAPPTPSAAYFRHRIGSYMAQDRAAGRDLLLGEPVDAGWWAGQARCNGMVCPGCREPMEWWEVASEDGTSEGWWQDTNRAPPSLVTLNRRNNALGHFKDNCELMCMACNRST